MTSNAGSAEMTSALNRPPIGFLQQPTTGKSDVKNVALKALRDVFPPEFLNRIDVQVVFDSLQRERGDFHLILWKFIEEVNTRSQQNWGHSSSAGYKQHPIIKITQELADHIVKTLNPLEGVRNLRALFETQVLAKVPDYIRDTRVNDGSMLAGIESGEVVFYQQETT